MVPPNPSSPQSVEPEVAALNAGGLELHNQGKIQEAISIFTEALRLAPRSGILYYNLANSLKANREFESAVAHYRKSLELGLKIPEVLNNLGVSLRHLIKYNEALDCFKGAAYLDPSFKLAHLNIGFQLILMGKPHKALTPLLAALKSDPGDGDVHWFLSHAYLILGDYDKGWKEYEWRWKKMDSSLAIRGLQQPLWTGDLFKDKTILLWSEQGFGDTLQFIRFARQVKARGGKVLLECQPTLRRLLQRTDGIDIFIDQGEALPDFDLQCPLLSLPKILGTTVETIPSMIPYVHVDPSAIDYWKEHVEGEEGFKVGLVWSGNPIHEDDRNRSLDPELIQPLFRLSEVKFFSLQKGQAAAEAAALPLKDLSILLTDFEKTAGLIEKLDLVITVDTSVAHLAGALGKEVWTLLPFSPDWRWLLNRPDSPWYPSMKLFRQTKPGDWKTVIKKVVQELSIVIKTRCKTRAPAGEARPEKNM
jgi:tetratricopeptide (TPR) repeat protein